MMHEVGAMKRKVERTMMKKFYIPLIFAVACFGLVVVLRLHAAIWDDLRDAFDKIKNFQSTVNDLTNQIEEKTHIASTLQNQVNSFTQQINGLTQKVNDLTDKINKTGQSIAHVVSDTVFVGNAIKSAVVTIKDQDKPAYDKADLPSQKMLIVAKMIDDIVPVLRSINQSINTTGGLVNIFDQNAYQQVMQASQQIDRKSVV